MQVRKEGQQKQGFRIALWEAFLTKNRFLLGLLLLTQTSAFGFQTGDLVSIQRIPTNYDGFIQNIYQSNYGELALVVFKDIEKEVFQKVVPLKELKTPANLDEAKKSLADCFNDEFRDRELGLFGKTYSPKAIEEIAEVLSIPKSVASIMVDYAGEIENEVVVTTPSEANEEKADPRTVTALRYSPGIGFSARTVFAEDPLHEPELKDELPINRYQEMPVLPSRPVWMGSISNGILVFFGTDGKVYALKFPYNRLGTDARKWQRMDFSVPELVTGKSIHSFYALGANRYYALLRDGTLVGWEFDSSKLPKIKHLEIGSNPILTDFDKEDIFFDLRRYLPQPIEVITGIKSVFETGLGLFATKQDGTFVLIQRSVHGIEFDFQPPSDLKNVKQVYTSDSHGLFFALQDDGKLEVWEVGTGKHLLLHESGQKPNQELGKKFQKLRSIHPLNLISTVGVAAETEEGRLVVLVKDKAFQLIQSKFSFGTEEENKVFQSSKSRQVLTDGIKRILVLKEDGSLWVGTVNKAQTTFEQIKVQFGIPVKSIASAQVGVALLQLENNHTVGLRYGTKRSWFTGTQVKRWIPEFRKPKIHDRSYHPPNPVSSSEKDSIPPEK